MLSPDIANEWLVPELPATRATQIVKECCRPGEEFEWFPVSRAVGNVRNQGQELVLPIQI